MQVEPYRRCGQIAAGRPGFSQKGLTEVKAQESSVSMATPPSEPGASRVLRVCAIVGDTSPDSLEAD